jgi:hypothetical protein
VARDSAEATRLLKALAILTAVSEAENDAVRAALTAQSN